MEPMDEILETVREIRKTQLAAIERQKRSQKYLLAYAAFFFLVIIGVYLFVTWHTITHP
jgi:hypothetical protein